MDNKIKRKKRKRRIRTSTLFFLFLTLASNSFAWFIYSTKVSNSITAKVRSWHVNFNVGGGDSFIKSNVVKYIKLKMYEQAIYYWKQWNKIRNDKTKQLEISEGLINRRNAEIELFQGR